MSVQILGLRPSFQNPEKNIEKFYEEHWRAPSVQNLFENLETVLETIPKDEHYNLYYTAAQCFEERGRKLKEQHIIPFDIDKIDLNRIEETLDIALLEIGGDRSKMTTLCSGNGLQIILQTSHVITNEEYFDDNRAHYKAIVNRINKALKLRQIPGEADPSVFSKARILRLPMTLNKKKGKEDRQAYFINRNLETQDYDITVESRLPKVEPGQYINKESFVKWPAPDTKAVLEGCAFLNHMRENPTKINEPQWYAGLSILGNLESGDVLAQEYSKGHPSYNFHETQEKLKQAMDASGPRTCKNIDTLWEGCSTCPHHGKVISPVAIRGEGYIKTKTTGFYDITIDSNGLPKRGKPNYEDLRKYFESKFPYMVEKKSNLFYIFDGKKWNLESDVFLNSFAEEHFNPKPSNAMCAEFVGAVYRNNLRESVQLAASIEKKVNFQNGVYDIAANKFVPHSPDYGFMYVLPYSYDENAKAPQWEKFLDEITLNRSDLKQTLLEFAGYAISGDSCWAQKALMLIGTGANGKSTFMNAIKNVVGEKNVSYLSLSHMTQPVYATGLMGKLFNMTEETDANELAETGPFKNIVTGGSVSMRFHYKQPTDVTTNVKLIFAANSMPKISDLTEAMFRRLLIVPFDAGFEGRADRKLEEKLKGELPGIFNSILAAYRNLIARGEFIEHITLKQMKKRLLEENDVAAIGDWLDSKVELVDMENLNCAGTFIQDLYNDYSDFANRAGERAASRKLFLSRLSRIVDGFEKRKEIRTNNGKKVFVRGMKVNGIEKAHH